MKTDEYKIKEILQLLQEGYYRRDPNYLDKFMKIYSTDDSSLIIGTEQGGVFRGFENAKQLFLGDWKEWGDVKYDINTSDIVVKGDMAWIFMFAELKMKFSAKNLNEIALKIIKNTLENEITSENAKIVDILRTSALNIVEKSKSEISNYPLRVTVILTRENESWFISHMHFSHPVGLFDSFPREIKV